MVIPYARTTITNQFLMHNCKKSDMIRGQITQLSPSGG